VTLSRGALDPAPERLSPADRISGGATEPLAGVRSSFVTGATRRVARRLHDESAAQTNGDVVPALLAAIALAIDRRHSEYVSMLLPRPSPELGLRLVEMLRAELLKGWADRASATAPSVLLDALTALEQVREAFERHRSQSPSAGATGASALDLLVEVVHDLRSPLTSILCLADTLQRGQSGAINELQHRQLGLIYSVTLGLSGVVSDALELGRGEELIENEPVPLSLCELLERVANITRPMSEEKGLRIELTTAQPDRRLGQPMALSRVLLNLTTNALKFTERGGVEIACAVRRPPRIEFSVTDTGPGINPDALVSLYDPFRLARGRAGYRFSGTGLGLAISRKLVGAMGSELKLDTGDWGTRFYFEVELPALPTPGSDAVGR